MSVRCPDLPLLPGLCPSRTIGRVKFPRRQHFARIESVPMLTNKVDQGIYGNYFQPDTRYPSIYARGSTKEIPAWLSLDGKILRFDAYFQETLQEFRSSAFQIRKCVVLFFLEDGTIKVIEPKVENSGISQGTLISRQRIRLSKPRDELFYDVIDFNVGKEIEFFGKVFKLTSCDEFTRKFLNRLGISVPDPIDVPKDPYYLDREHILSTITAKKPSSKKDTFGQFLENDGRVLRFYGYWDDRATCEGTFHDLEIHYFLAEDTIEIKEVISDNAGKDTGLMFLKRNKLPKFSNGLFGPGYTNDMTVLNVLGPGLQEGRYVIDPLNCGKSTITYYKQNDLAIGAQLNCYGRKIVLTNCDPFTKDYYRVKYGIDNFSPLSKPQQEEPVQFLPLYKRTLPPWNGYGSFEDSAQNCVTVELKPLLRNLKQFLTYDREGLNSHILRFLGRLVSNRQEEGNRRYIICYYLSDNTISIHDYSGTHFIRRGPIKLPGQEEFTSVPPDYYQPQHMFIGAKVNFNGFIFVLVDADEYALRFMERHANEFPKSNISVIMNKVREKLAPIYKDFVAANLKKESTVMSYEDLRNQLCQIMGENWSEHEMITLARHYSAVCKTERHDRNYIRSLVLTELKKYLWNDLDRLRERFRDEDYKQCGLLPRNTVYSILRGCRLPLDKELTESMLDVIKKNEQCEIEYQDIFAFIDRNYCPPSDALPTNIKHDCYWTSELPLLTGKLIDWCAFNKTLNLEHLFNEKAAMP